MDTLRTYLCQVSLPIVLAIWLERAIGVTKIFDHFVHFGVYILSLITYVFETRFQVTAAIRFCRIEACWKAGCVRVLLLPDASSTALTHFIAMYQVAFPYLGCNSWITVPEPRCIIIPNSSLIPDLVRLAIRFSS